MDPDGTIYFIINLIISVFVCLYIAGTRRSEEIDDFEIGLSKDMVSAIFLYMANMAFFVSLVMPKFDLQLKCIYGALFVFLGTFVPYCVGLALHKKMIAVKKLLTPVITILNYTVTLVITLPVGNFPCVQT